MQGELAGKAADLATAQEQHAASDADWESRMKDAVSSAEQWKEFAEKLGAEKEALQATLASTEQQLSVSGFALPVLAETTSIIKTSRSERIFGKLKKPLTARGRAPQPTLASIKQLLAMLESKLSLLL